MSTDAEAVEALNAELYAAFEAGDADRMAAVWDGDDVVCVHPGWAPVRGRAAVLRSWSLIMANTTYIQFFLTDVQTLLSDDLAVLTCTENILTALGEDTEAARVIATNVFRRSPRGWQLWLHHGSPVLAPERQAPEEPAT